MSSPDRTLPALFESTVDKHPGNIYLREKKDGEYGGATYAQIRESVHRCACGLISIGLVPGDRVALISEGRNDWVIAELGILYAGGINVPLSVKLEESSELQFRLSHAGCRMVIVSGNQALKILKLREKLPALETIILLDPIEARSGAEVFFPDLLEEGGRWLEIHRQEFIARWHSVRESDPANICYTSGTTADPKGIVLTHRNYTANIEQSIALYPLPESFVTLLILPWDHAFAHTDGIYAVAATGSSMASVQVGRTGIETLRNIPGNIREIRPTFLMSVPALARNFRKSIENGVTAKGAVAGLLFRAGLRIAFAYITDGFHRGRGWRRLVKPVHQFFDAILFRKIRENFGGRMQYFIGGGGLLDLDLQRFFAAIGMPMYQGYGLTEAAPVISANTPVCHKFGTSGMLVPDLELRICDEAGRDLPDRGRGRGGEIVVRGENVMAGYWCNEKATADALRGGWLHTGDLGYVDADGFLVVLGREKSLLIGHDGEKFSPEGIEEMIAGNSPFIDQMMLYNNQSPYTVSLVVPNTEALLRMLRSHHLNPGTPEGVDKTLRLLEGEIASYRAGGKHAGMFPERWLPSAIAVLDEPFSEQNRLLNSTLKMVRGKIAAAHRTRLESMFTPEGRNVCNPQNRDIMEKLIVAMRGAGTQT